MPVNFDDIKKLSDKEKLELIDQILASIDDEVIDEYLVETDANNVLHERMEKYKSGKTTFNSWENIQRNLKEKNQKKSQEGGE